MLLLPVMDMDVLEHLGAHLGCSNECGLNNGMGAYLLLPTRMKGRSILGHLGDVTKDPQVFPRSYFDILSLFVFS